MAMRTGRGAVNIDLPYDQSGEVDWNTLGKILTAHLLGEVLCASYVDHRHKDRKVDFQPETDWQFLYEKDEVVVLIKQIPKPQLTTFIGRGVIDAPLDDVAAFIKDIQNNYIWDKYLVEAKYLKVLSQSESHTDYIGYQNFGTTRCLVPFKRDILYYVRCIYTDGKYVQTSISVEDPDYPVHPDVTRVEAFAGTGFVAEPYQGSSSKTLLSYLGNGAWGLPQFMTTLVLKWYPLAVRHIRRQLTRLQKQQQKKETRRKEQHKPPHPLFVRSTEAESNATPELPRVKPYEEAMPIGHFMRARSGIRNRPLPIQSLDQDLRSPAKLSVQSATSQSEADLSDQSPTLSASDQFYTPTQGEIAQDENIISDIRTDHIVDSDTAIKTGSADLVNS